MRSWTILIFNCLLLGFGLVNPVKGQELSVRSGIYDFTNNTTREFYVVAPTVLVGYDVWTISRVSFQITSGLSFNTSKYNNDRHYLYMIPLFLTATYNLPNPHARLFPVIGGGFCLMQKIDKNASLLKTHFGITYGFQATGGLRYRFNPGFSIALDIAYNILFPFTTEETNINGFLYTFGLRIPFNKE